MEKTFGGELMLLVPGSRWGLAVDGGGSWTFHVVPLCRMINSWRALGRLLHITPKKLSSFWVTAGCGLWKVSIATQHRACRECSPCRVALTNGCLACWHRLLSPGWLWNYSWSRAQLSDPTLLSLVVMRTSGVWQNNDIQLLVFLLQESLYGHCNYTHAWGK
jgi:hypothetical protein